MQLTLLPHPTPPHPRLPDVDLWDGNESVSINIHKPEVRFSSLHNWMTLESQLRVNPGAKAKRLCNEPIPQVSLTVRDQFWFAGIRTGAIWPLRGIWLWSAGGLNQEREVCKAWQCPLLMYFLHSFCYLPCFYHDAIWEPPPLRCTVPNCPHLWEQYGHFNRTGMVKLGMRLVGSLLREQTR